MLRIDQSGNLVRDKAPEIPALYISPSLYSRIWLYDNLVLLLVDTIEKDFMVESVSDETWMVTVACEGLGDERFTTKYVFGEELEIIGKADALPEHQEIVQNTLQSPKKILILKRKI